MRATFAALLLAGALGAQGATIEWLHDLDAGIARAAKERKPLFLVFRCEP